MRLNDQLQADVEALCRELQRPISSKDMLRFYIRFPDRRPHLLQRLGQCLFKLARPKGDRSAFIVRVGIIGNLAFYAPDESAFWRDAFFAYKAMVALAQQHHFRLPDYTTRLLGTKFDGLARNALAGWIEEYSEVIERCPDSAQVAKDVSELIEKAKAAAAPTFVRAAPTNLVTREAAADILRDEYGKRTPLSEPDAMNTARHLVHLSWPQSCLFPKTPKLFWGDQVRAYCASRWPITTVEQEFARGLSLAMIYGEYPISSR